MTRLARVRLTRFKYQKKALNLLWTLVTTYWDALTTKGGDANAKQFFGDAYAAKEAETLSKEGNRNRVFYVRGEPIAMLKHLKIGVKDSIAETLRVHFEWFPKDKKIVIGHCGAHLNF